MQRPTRHSLPAIGNPSNRSVLSHRPNASELVKSWLFVHEASAMKNVVHLSSPRQSSFSRLSISELSDSLTELTASHSSRTSSFLSESSSVATRTPSNVVPSRFSLLEVHSSLSEDERKRFEEIRQQVPEEFDRLLPTLLRLGLVLWPQQFFDENTQLTRQQIRQRQQFKAILDADQRQEEKNRQLQRLYGGISSRPTTSSNKTQNHRLRENLSHQGQLSLAAAYRDEIETELTKKSRLWKSIPMRVLRASFSEESTRSSVPRRVSFLEPLTPRLSSVQKKKSSLRVSRYIRQGLVPDRLDEDWQRKLFGKIIEHGMTILDDARNLRDPRQEEEEEDVTRAFKRWIFLWFTLFHEED